MKGEPCCFPLKQCARVQLVRAQLKDAAFLTGWRGGQKGKFLRKLRSPGSEKRPKSIVGSLVLCRGKKEKKKKTQAQNIWNEHLNPESSSMRCLSRSGFHTPERGLGDDQQ